MRCEERNTTGSFALGAKGAGRKLPNKNDAYDSPASARSSARSRSASTMANLRATCINDTHIRFLTCVAFHHLLLLLLFLLGDLAASENSGGGGMARHRRLIIVVIVAVVAVIGRVTVFTEIFSPRAQSLSTSSCGGFCV